MIISIDVHNDNFTITGAKQFRYFDNIATKDTLTPGVDETINMKPKELQVHSKIVIKTEDKTLAVILPASADVDVFLDNGDPFDEF